MIKHRPYLLSIAGFDPSGGAGILADIKTFEQTGTYGIAATTCISYQNDHNIAGLHLISKEKILQQLNPLLSAYKIEYVKIGWIQNLKILNEIVDFLLAYNKDICIVWDPILETNEGVVLHKKINKKYLQNILTSIHWVTPNWEEVTQLTGEKDAIKGAEILSKYCNVYLKGGHHIEVPATDIILINKKMDILHPTEISELEKHGAGCVLSAALASYLALGMAQYKACNMAKEYTYRFITSNNSNIGYHAIV